MTADEQHATRQAAMNDVVALATKTRAFDPVVLVIVLLGHAAPSHRRASRGRSSAASLRNICDRVRAAF